MLHRNQKLRFVIRCINRLPSNVLEWESLTKYYFIGCVGVFREIKWNFHEIEMDFLHNVGAFQSRRLMFNFLSSKIFIFFLFNKIGKGIKEIFNGLFNFIEHTPLQDTIFGSFKNDVHRNMKFLDLT